MERKQNVFGFEMKHKTFALAFSLVVLLVSGPAFAGGQAGSSSQAAAQKTSIKKDGSPVGIAPLPSPKDAKQKKAQGGSLKKDGSEAGIAPTPSP